MKLRALAIFVCTGGSALLATDLRIASNANIPIAVLENDVWTQETIIPGGRVGNWRPDNVAANGVIVLDTQVQHSRDQYPDDIYTMQVPTTAPPFTTAQHLTSISADWTAGGTSVPKSGLFIGNPWFCPTSDRSHPENEYILFQAQDKNSRITNNANPGIGIDNQVWIYSPSSKKVWQLTFYTELSQQTPTAIPGGGVLGPQCSEDSDSSTGILHIVYAHIIQAVPSNFGNTGGPSSIGKAWFGDWELVYADVTFDGSGNLVCPGTGETPCFTNQISVNPRDAVTSPFTPVSGTDGAVTASSCVSGGSQLNSASSNFSSVKPGAGVQISGAPFMFPYQYSIISSVIDNHDLCLSNTMLTAGSSYHFVARNMTYIEPHRYLSNRGDLYYSTNSLYVLHDSAGARFNPSPPTLQILNQTYPTGESPAPGLNANVANTWFNEFLTPFPAAVTTPLPKPIGRSIFMSDRTTTSKWSQVPEYSDHYMCGPPNCQIPIRITEYNNPDGSAGPDSTCPSCTTVVAVRGAWSPSGSQYLTMNQYVTAGSPPSYAEIHLYNLQFPRTELGGTATLSGTAILQ